MAAGCGFAPATRPADANQVDAPDTPDARRDTATLFVADYNASMIHRFALAPGAPPPPATSFGLAQALSPVVMPTGELFVGELANSTIARFTDPVGALVPNGKITGLGLSTSFGKMVAVDNELWVVNAASTNLDRLAFDAAGAASMAGTVGGIVSGVGRGLVFYAATRDLYVTECCGTDTILHFAVAADRTVTPKPKLSGNGLANPHGMVVTPWHELLVANAGDATIRRFTLGAYRPRRRSRAARRRHLGGVAGRTPRSGSHLDVRNRCGRRARRVRDER